MAMTKEKIINYVHLKIGFSKSKARDMVESLLEIMKQVLEREEDLLISGFGKILVKKKSSRKGRNPQTKEDLVLRARKVVVFKTSGVLRNAINSK